jgi:hypothetical protein
VPEPAACGDVALSFGSTTPGRARAGSRWEVIEQGEGWRLWTAAPTTAWRGYGAVREASGRDLRLTLGTRPDHWLELRLDGGTGRWTVRTDRFGTLHCYAGEGLVTTFSPAAWGQDPPLDWLAIAGFFRLGWYPADRLPVRGVHLLRPGHEHAWDEHGVPLGARRWAAWAHDPAPTTVAEAADRVGGALAAVLDEQAAGGRLAVPVSGGLDSRTTVAVLTRDAGPPADLWAYSYGYEEASPELRIAGQVAAARALPLHTTVIPPYLFTDLDRVLDATEGLVDVTLCRQAAVVDELASHADAVVAAHWGDVWFGAPAPGPGQGPADALLAASTKRGHRWLIDHVVRPHLGHDPTDDLRDLLGAEAATVAHLVDPVVALTALKTEQWSLRWTEATLRMFQAAVPPRLPFYDPRVVDVLLTLPSDLLSDRRLQVDHLRRHAPDLARIEWQAVETDLFRLRHERTWRLPRRALRRLRRRLRPPRSILRNWETQLLSEPGRAGVDRWLVEPGAALHDVVDRGDVVQLVADHRSAPRDPERGYAVSMLLTWALWRERFT